ncbi:Ig-like domain repeat protein, partial [bacterium]|nr:Ig-like domain repeat protein [bacterium]
MIPPLFFRMILSTLVMITSALAQTHPFIIVKDTDYASLQALSVGGASKVPFIRMRSDAVNISNTTTYSEAAALGTRLGSLIKIMDSTALAYIVDPANRNTYRNRFYQYLKYWDLAQNGNITKDLNIASWEGGVQSAAAFFATVIAQDIIYNDPNTTAAQILQRNGFNAMMEVTGPVGAMGPATFYNTQYEPYHLTSLMSARAIWALWKGGILNNAALDAAVAGYKEDWLSHITDDGCFVEYSGYAMARAGDPSRYNKGVFHDVIVYSGIDPAWYANPKMANFYEWLAGYAQGPNRYGWPIGDSSYAPFSATYASPFDRASKFSPLAGRYGEWLQNGATPAAKLFSYLARARTPGTVTALEPVSRIFQNGGAYLRQKNGGVNSLAAVLTNLKAYSVPNVGHIHKATNSLNIASFGEILMRGPGYNGYGAAASAANNFGFDFSYVNNHAISENIALFNYNITNYQNPSFTNDHRAKHGGYGVKGLLSDGLDYAACDSGLLTDAARAINNGHHIRHTVAVYPQDGVNGYVYAIDELEGNSSATTGQLAWHPYSNNITFNADNAGSDRYEWQIRQKANTTDQLHFSIFMPTAPDTKQQYDGLFADDIQGGASTSFVGKYIFNGYTLNTSTKKKNVLTMFFPRKSTQVVPTMARISPTGGAACQAAVFAFAGNINDFAMESDGASERTLVSATYDATGAAARGKAVVYRKIGGNVAFYFVGKGRSFKNTPTGFTRGFVSDAEVDVHMKGNAGSIVSTGTNVTFYAPGNPAVRLNGGFVAPLSSGAGFARVAIPAGTHTVSLEEGAIATTTTLASNANPSSFGANVIFTATVTSASGIPAGTVTFFDGATSLGTATLNGSGAASLTTGSLAVGTRSITATFTGNASHVASTSPPLSQTIGSSATATVVSSSANPSYFGENLVFSATVTAAAGTPAGSVTWFDGSSPIGSATLNASGIGSLSISNLGVGTHSITASYAGNGNFNASTSPALSQVITNSIAATTTVLASDTNPSNPGAPVTLTASVTSAAGIPAGAVTFFDGSNSLGTATLDGSGIATLVTTVLTTGSHSLTASYGGSSTFAVSTSAALSQTVNANTGTPVAISWSGGGNNGLFGNSANWVGGALPATNGKALFINNANTAVSLGASHTFFSLEFGSAALGSFSFSAAVPGNQFVGYGSGANIGVLATATGSPTISFDNDLA